MRIAVVGGGTAGTIAAAHLTHHMPHAELLHIQDSRIPRIGVGEGTTPRFPPWFDEITKLGYSDLQERCNATLKHGTRFEGWGPEGEAFVNRFQPVRLIGYHFDATDLVEVLAEFVEATHIDARVDAITQESGTATLRLEDGTTHEVDCVFDARGFPPLESLDETSFSWIPTNAAILHRTPPIPAERVTRAVARPHGWIFVIPLAHFTSLGYIHNAAISEEAEVQRDFDAFFEEEGLEPFTQPRFLRFPNYVRKQPLEGVVFRIGNAASFIEPLEATSIGTAILQVREALTLLEQEGALASPLAVARHNAGIRQFVTKNALFLAWHYANGSRWNSRFWEHARSCIGTARQDPQLRPYFQELDAFVESAAEIRVDDITAPRDNDEWVRDVMPRIRMYHPFGNFSELNFAQVGHGIGYYAAAKSAASR